LLEKEDIINIHEYYVSKENSNTEPGIINEGFIDEIAKKPDLIISGIEIYDNIYEKGASLLELAIRLHPFVDGNKRTALMTLSQYLWENNYFILLPMSSTRRMILIANSINQDEDSVNHLVRKTAKWVKRYTINLEKPSIIKIVFSQKEILLMAILLKIKIYPIAIKLLSTWFAYDIYPNNSENLLTDVEKYVNNYKTMLENLKNFLKF
jgi:death-on-curing protein